MPYVPPAMPAPPARPATLRPRRRWFSFAGAGAMIAVGYMDPGNWATDLAAGSHYGYTLLSVVLLSSLLAMLLQWLASRVGLVSGRDLAELCRDQFGRRGVLALWLASEVAIIACDVGEVVGTAVAVQLLLGVSLSTGVWMSSLGTFALLAIRGLGHRASETLVILLMLFVAACLITQLSLIHPDWFAIARGMIPDRSVVSNAGMLWLAAGIVGATVMPHNLYLHSTLVKGAAGPCEPGAAPRSSRDIDEALRGVNLDTVSSLTFAFLINAALLVVAAAALHASGHADVDDLAEAYRLLAWPHGGAMLFALALLACGLNSTLTGTLAGQAVMEGFLHWKIKRWQRMLITRALALGPALVAVALLGDGGSNRLLVGSQVVLSLQLPLVVIPLIRFASDRQLMTRWRVGGATLGLCWVCSAALIVLNGALLWQIAAP